MAGWFWLIAWGLWWLVISLGAQGFAPVMALVGLLAIPTLFKQKLRPSPDLIVLFAFLAWCIATSLWTEGTASKLITLDFKTGNLAISSPGLRLSVTALLYALGFWAIHFTTPKLCNRISQTIPISVGVQLIIFLTGVIAFEAFTSFYGQMSDKGNLRQNMSRAVNMATLAIPLLVASLPGKSIILRLMTGLIANVICVLFAFKSGSQAMLLSLVAILGAAGMTFLLGRNIFRLLGIVTALLILSMPFLLSGLLHYTNNLTQDDIPASFYSRLICYDYVIEKIHESFFTGWGVEASKYWEETIEFTMNGHPYQYRIVPGHPHNMGLQVWAETGMLGATLLSGFVFLLGERLRRSSTESRLIMTVGATIWAGALVHGLVSYSLWNDAFWAGILFLASGILALSRRPSAGAEAC